MADVNGIELDVEGIRSNVTNVALSINDNEGQYSEEWLTTDCISSVFKSANDILSSFESTKSVLSSHLDELDEIAAEVAQRIDMFNKLKARFPSRRNNNTATVNDNVSSLNVRKGPGTNNDVVGYVKKGAVLKVIGASNDGWTEVLLDNGTKGYVASKYITVNPYSTLPQSFNTSDKPIIDSKPTQTVKLENQETLTPHVEEITPPSVSEIISEEEPTKLNTEEIIDKPPVLDDKPPIKDYATAIVSTQTHGLNVRSGKGTDTAIKTKVAKGSTITILEEDNGSGWTKVKLADGTEGYVSTKYIRINQDESQIQKPSVLEAEPVSRKINEEEITKVSNDDMLDETPTIEDTQFTTATVSTKNYGLNVRSGKGTDTAIKTSVSKGSTLTILEKDDGSGWTKVKLADGTEGYVSSTYLKVNQPNINSYNGTAIVNTKSSELNLRSSENGNILTSIPTGTKIDIGESKDGWTKVKYNDYVGYVSTSLLSDIDYGDE